VRRRRPLRGLVLATLIGVATSADSASAETHEESLAPAVGGAGRSDYLEFKVKRESIFEFVQKPRVTRTGDRVTIAFETKGFCDATVAIENAEGKIIRHLASGVLGPNAPEPFQKNSKTQTVVWDGKNDQGTYIDDKDALTIRVSLGLKPEYERAFQWSPYRRAGGNTPVICPAPEGVYVFEGSGFDHLRLFDHDGNYVRTVYPFPADKVDQVRGVKRHVMPQSGKDLPLKWGFYESTLLTSGYTGLRNSAQLPAGGAATLAMAIHKNRIFLPGLSLNRIATDGTSGGMPLEGPRIAISVQWHRWGDRLRRDVAPRSAAVSPDGKTLYFTGFGWDRGQDFGGFDWTDGVAQMDTLGNDPPRPFVGLPLKQGKENAGTDNTHFRQPFSVACDAQGRVYIADYGNDRIQVFNPDGTHVKTIPVSRPTEVCIHQKTGDIYVFSWLCAGRYTPDKWAPGLDLSKIKVPAVMRHLGPLSDPREISSCPLPLPEYTRYLEMPHFYNRGGGIHYRAALDSWTDPPTIWLVPGATWVPLGYSNTKLTGKEAGLLLLTEKNGKLEVKRDFGREAAKTLAHLRPPMSQRQRLHVNPETGTLYVAEGDDTIEGKSFHELIEIDPTTGRHRLVQMPFNAEDLAFDLNGLIYLRTLKDIVRYDPVTWKEIPFDYGEKRERVGYGFVSGTRTARALSAITFDTTGVWHQGGIGVSPKGHIAAAFYYSRMKKNRRFGQPVLDAARPYTPTLYPGRGGTAIVHVWDKHGRVLAADAIPGLGVLDGLAIDKNDDLYVLAATTRILDGKRYFDYMTGTAMKFRLGKAKVITTNEKVRIPLAAADGPKRPQELDHGSVGPAWAEGVQWFYGGVGFAGKNSPVGHACACWNSRFCLDYYARSFVPEIQHYTVGVLHTSGNLILRNGRYGNEDDGMPLTKGGGPSNPRSIGGDEVGLFYPAYLGTHTDRRLFIADVGNARIVSVRLDYHAEERIRLRDVPDAVGGKPAAR